MTREELKKAVEDQKIIKHDNNNDVAFQIFHSPDENKDWVALYGVWVNIVSVSKYQIMKDMIKITAEQECNWQIIDL